MTALFPLMPGVSGQAYFSPENRFRYWLERRWDPTLPQFTYVLLNPSEAGGDRDARTSKNLCALTAANGGGGYELVNLLALVDTHQDDLRYPGAIGGTPATNDGWIVKAVERSELLILGWGDGSRRGRGGSAHQSDVRRRAMEVWPVVRFSQPKSFMKNSSGAPRHPGRLSPTSPISAYVPTPEYLAG